MTFFRLGLASSAAFGLILSGAALAQAPAPAPAQPDANAGKTTVFSVDGGPPEVTVKGTAGIRKVKIGEALVAGDEVMGDAGSVVVLQLPDGSHIKLARGSQVGVSAPVNGVPTFDLRSGSARGTTAGRLKGTEENLQEKLKAKEGSKHILYIRTRSAVLGVRGTDFVVSYDTASQTSEFHTLQGMVEIGQNIEGLNLGKFMRVADGRFVRADPTRINRPQQYDPDSYLRNLYESKTGLVPETELQQEGDFRWKRFRLGGVWAHNDTGDSFSGQVLWAPWLKLGPRWGVGFAAGGSMYKGLTGESNFFVIEGGANATYRISRVWEAEVGGGAQIWMNKSTNLMITGTVAWIPRKGWIPLLERIFVGYEHVLTSVATMTVRVGAGISF